MASETTLTHYDAPDHHLGSPTRLPPPGPSILRNPTGSADGPARRSSSSSSSEDNQRVSPEQHPGSLLATLSATLRRVLASTPERRRRRLHTPDAELWLAGSKSRRGSLASCAESPDGLVCVPKRQQSPPAVSGAHPLPGIRFAPLPLLTHPRPCGLGIATRAALLSPTSPTSPTHANALSPPSLSSSSSSGHSFEDDDDHGSTSSDHVQSNQSSSDEVVDGDDRQSAGCCGSNKIYHSEQSSGHLDDYQDHDLH